MSNRKLMFVLFLVFIFIILFAYLLLNPRISAFSTLSENKCNTLGDDCWHSLAHQTFNKIYCLKIIDNKTKEHCFEHIPEIDKEDK